MKTYNYSNVVKNILKYFMQLFWCCISFFFLLADVWKCNWRNHVFIVQRIL